MIMMVKAFAPATIANLGPGFDMFGLAINGVGDIVEAQNNYRVASGTAKLTGIHHHQSIQLPLNNQNVAQAASTYLLNSTEYNGTGISLFLHKNMGIGTGLGSSASSTIAAIVAVNGLLRPPLERDDRRMLDAAIRGESVAVGGDGHADNVFPALLGGFVFITNFKTRSFVRLDVNDNLWFTVVSPNVMVKTADARAALNALPIKVPALVSLASRWVLDCMTGASSTLSTDYSSIVDHEPSVDDAWHERIHTYLTGTVNVFSGIKTGNATLLGRAMMMDQIITPVRSKLIPAFDIVKDVMLAAGAEGVTISGSGPSMVSVAGNQETAERIARDSVQAFQHHANVEARAIVSQANNEGAKILQRS